MRRTFALSAVAALLVLAVVVASAGTAAASPQPTTTQENSTTTDARGERIDGDLRLLSSSYNGDGVATLTFEVDQPKAVTLSDAGGFVDGGRIHRETFVLEEGTHTVEFQVTESERGYVGVSIATDAVLYAEVLRSPSIQPFAGSSGTTGWLGGAGIVVTCMVVAALWVLRKEGDEPVEAGQ